MTQLPKFYVQPEDVSGVWHVAIYNEDGSLVGVPARGLTYEQAVMVTGYCRHSFAYGLEFFRRFLSKVADKSWVDVKEKYPQEI